ncbi:transglycosylase SLT domain-containing protein [Actinacidiphila sp. ITFR-21]|uniref:aggregation-promoting factor C-terminal-like domain-containing protein n=1 Tax=Actinacidiphila sp. ITFR-21 TaxID=3075199 RepID=UPI002889B0BE|nr:transglycosylase SLT domain-containing protein [Streptomyces sp. ITFR-21]WNI17570.1 transglycosylase SLT domain-containing protein [Streptomyces sp. ITFR-21]WNI17710.1 transglycosylase SLT domain-containing protein [Streptomyces sp. ITFR-21]
MSRPKFSKLPNISWHTCRLISAAAAVLLTTLYLVQPADAKPPQSPPPPAVLTPSMIPLDLVPASSHLEAVSALQQQASAQAANYRRVQAEAAARRRAAAEAAERRVAAQRRAQAAAERQAAADAAAERQAVEQRTASRSSRSAARVSLSGQAPTVAGAKNFARAQLSSSQYTCLDNVVDHESGWNLFATNPSSGAYGLMQALPGSKMASAGSDWRTNPRTQIKWGLSYMENNYGTPCGAWNFWQKNGWY